MVRWGVDGDDVDDVVDDDVDDDDDHVDHPTAGLKLFCHVVDCAGCDTKGEEKSWEAWWLEKSSQTNMLYLLSMASLKSKV